MAWAVTQGRRFVGVWAGSRRAVRVKALRHLARCRVTDTTIQLRLVPLGVAQ